LALICSVRCVYRECSCWACRQNFSMEAPLFRVASAGLSASNALRACSARDAPACCCVARARARIFLAFVFIMLRGSARRACVRVCCHGMCPWPQVQNVARPLPPPPILSVVTSSLCVAVRSRALSRFSLSPPQLLCSCVFFDSSRLVVFAVLSVSDFVPPPPRRRRRRHGLPPSSPPLLALLPAAACVCVRVAGGVGLQM
jgi:hypothetical protein